MQQVKLTKLKSLAMMITSEFTLIVMMKPETSSSEIKHIKCTKSFLVLSAESHKTKKKRKAKMNQKLLWKGNQNNVKSGQKKKITSRTWRWYLKRISMKLRSKRRKNSISSHSLGKGSTWQIIWNLWRMFESTWNLSWERISWIKSILFWETSETRS